MYKAVCSVYKGFNANISCKCIIERKIMPVQSYITRNLYAQEAIGINGFNNAKERTRAQFSNMNIKFKTKMIDYTNSDTKNMIFTEDLKNMIYLADDQEDVNLVINMVKRFNSQNQQLRFGNFIFGPVVMRMFHVLNKPTEAMEAFMNEDFSGFFDQLISYQLLLDLLYENGKYDEVRSTFDFIKSKQIQGTKYPKNIVVLAMAACYKQNSKESYDYAKKLWQELNEVGHLPMRRTVTFFAGLALKQGDPSVALQVLSQTRNPNYVTVRNIKVAALAAIGRFDNILPILKYPLNVDNHEDSKKQTFCFDVMEAIQEAVHKSADAELQLEFNKTEKYLKEQGHIINESLDQQLCSVIENVPTNQHRKDNLVPTYRKYNNEQNFKNRSNQRDFTYRPSLNDMH